jgi:uncharacterized protein YdhG (YjbR/CyaY superfamily)
MASSKNVNDPKLVNQFIKKLPTEFAALVEAVRQVILKTNDNIGEHIKWNAPAFFYTGEMADFDPKTYKRDIAVMNLRKKEMLLVFPTGETVKDISDILEGDYTDGRRLVRISDAEDLDKKAAELQKVITVWLSKIEK